MAGQKYEAYMNTVILISMKHGGVNMETKHNEDDDHDDELMMMTRTIITTVIVIIIITKDGKIF